MTTWIVFTINNQKVHQMTDSGYTGQDQIDATKVMVAGEYRVSEKEVKVSFIDEEARERVISSEMLKELGKMMTKKELKN